MRFRAGTPGSISTPATGSDASANKCPASACGRRWTHSKTLAHGAKGVARDRKKPLATVGARWAIEPRGALVDRGAQHVAMAAGCRGFGRDLGGGDGW